MSIQVIEPIRLIVAFVPVVLVLLIMLRWSLNIGTAVYALARMLGQLLLVGYILTTLFASEEAGIVLAVLFVMISAASWIALRTAEKRRRQLVIPAFFSILSGGGFTLLLMTQWVIGLEPWFEPHYMIPLAGMIFANAMNSVSLSAERMAAEMKHGNSYAKARNEAFSAAFIPAVNAMLAVGLVSLPGMMTGQILSGVSPIIAAHYQIMVMCMVFSSAGLSTMGFLYFSKKYWY